MTTPPGTVPPNTVPPGTARPAPAPADPAGRSGTVASLATSRDLRLVGPALAAWGAAAVGLHADSNAVLAGALAAVCVAGLVLWAAWRQRPRTTVGTTTTDPPADSTRRGKAHFALAAVLLAGAVGAATATLHAADLRRGPLPQLARQRADAVVDLEVTGDPELTRARASGARRGPTLVRLTGDATAVHPAGRPAVTTHTPVLVLVPVDEPTRASSGPGYTSPKRPVGGNRPPPGAQGTSTRAWLSLLPSTRLRVTARVTEPLPGGVPTAAVLRVTATGPPHQTAPAGLTQRLAGTLRAGLRDATDGLGPDPRGLLPGLVVGDTSRVPADLEEAFRATDLTHLLAVSGSNLSILLALLIGPPHLAGRAERRGLAPRLGLPLRTTAFAGGMLVAGFVVVCRPEPSVLRAAACGLITLLALATGRRRALVPALAAAVLLLVLVDPWLAGNYGFALSVLATGALLLVSPGWAEHLRRRGVPPRLAEALAATAAAQLVCAPLVVVIAGRVSLLAVPCNLLAEVAVIPATVLGFACLATASWAPLPAAVLAWVAAWPVRWIALVARTGASAPGAGFAWPGGAWGGLLLLLCLPVVVLVGRALLRRTWLCAVVVVCLVLFVLRPLPLARLVVGWPPPDWRMVACDVGQGDGLVLATGGDSAVVVDTGPDPGAIDGCLRDLGVRRIPLLLLTHFHADHVDGLPGVLHGRAVGVVETTGLGTPPGQAAFVRREVSRAHVPLVQASMGERRRVGPVSWEVLWPQPPPGDPTTVPPAVEGGTPADPGATPDPGEDVNPNDTSVALLVRTSGLTLALLGDLEPATQEALLAAHPDLPRVDVVKVAHHGSAHQSPQLLARLAPRLALISCGTGNPYGHPAPVTLAMLRAVGATVLRTDTSGSIAVTGVHGRPATVVRGRGRLRGRDGRGSRGPGTPARRSRSAARRLSRRGPGKRRPRLSAAHPPT
ncbi:ComEC/Rec2 family competence protein [Streptomyces sp. NPDC059740]|uniref:ComEC/Rec2 family competence protein n=1 Tax=Streptomyces sp. NPDC059740 TaxID=3346926 RepID=UPI003662FE03